MFNRKDEDLPHGTVRPDPAPYNVERPITASAARIDLKNKPDITALEKKHADAAWQQYCHLYTGSVPVIHFASDIIKSVTSRVRIYPALLTDLTEAPIYVEDAPEGALPPEVIEVCKKAMLRLANTPGGLGGLVSRIAVNLWVAGEGTLVEMPPSPKNHMRGEFKFLSTSQLVLKKGKVSYKPGKASKTLVDLSDSKYLARVWCASTEYDDDADSSVKCVQDFCDEFLAYARLRRTITRAKLHAGAFLVPSSITGSETQDEAPELEDFDGDFDPATVISNVQDPESDSFEEELIESFIGHLDDENNAGSIVPIMIRAAGEELEKVRYITFDRNIDEQLNEASDRALAQILSGLSLPEDMARSQANVRYSNSVKIESAFYKLTIQPLIVAICEALTVAYFKRALEAYGVSQEYIDILTIWFDASDILINADKSAAANDGHDRNLISDRAWRESHGFPETAAPSGEERLTKAVLARAQISEPLLDAVLQTVAPKILELIKSAAQQQNPELSQRAKDLLGYNTENAPGTPEAPPAPEPPPPTNQPAAPLPNGISEADLPPEGPEE